MPIYISYHSLSTIGSITVPKYSGGERIDILGPATGFDTFTPTGTANNLTTATSACLAKIVNANTDTRVAILDAANTTANTANNTNSEYWVAGQAEIRYIPKGYRISVKT